MDWKLFATTFVAIFLAELGDKTQLATLTLAASSPGRRWLVFGAAALALLVSSAVAVLLGGSLQVMPAVILVSIGHVNISQFELMPQFSWKIVKSSKIGAMNPSTHNSEAEGSHSMAVTCRIWFTVTMPSRVSPFT